MLGETIDSWLVLDQDLNCLLAGKFDCLAGWDLCAGLIDEFALLFRIQGGVKAQMLFSFNEIPVEFYSVVNTLVQSVIRDTEKRALDGSHQGASSGHRLA